MYEKLLSVVKLGISNKKPNSKIYHYIFNFNLTRGSYFFAINTLITSLLLTYCSFSYKETKELHHLVSALLSLLLMFIIFIFYLIWAHFKTTLALHTKRNFIALFMLPNCLVLIISLYISLIENNVIIFFSFVMLISTVFFITPILILIQNLLVGVLFITFSPLFVIDSPINYLSTVLVIVVSGLVTYNIFTNKRIEFQLFSNFRESNLVLKESNKELSEYSYSDALTGVNNRRRIEDLLKNNWKYCKANKLKLSILFLDIDNFKKYNDCYGHVQGDTCLVQIANAIQDLCMETSITHYCAMGRYGGEEFIIILPNTDQEKVTLFGQQVCNRIENLQIPHSNNEEHPYVTISCGATTFVPDDHKRILYILETADRALYHVKRSGKNNVIHYEDIGPNF